ncbi:hypothetical protein [Rhodococcus sp. PSBB049]|uniref:hypothetical protein n=1 Tax=Rhodococcus sp. PSBB049 TaxID=2812863 RepID=UPI00197CF6FD|nr:hypothetical protein [Rhodococcus sp. PSBB049]QSE72531.1 hypothetical protein JYA91_29945 [Rhodococcus sp. PSBB049]
MANGITYLHNSSVTTDFGLFATTNIWPALGMAFQPNQVGAMARLFKSGVLCDANGYWYNGAPTTLFSVSTSNPDCGSGWYNSHGLVRMADGSGGWVGGVTFPTNPVEFTAPGARTTGPTEGDAYAVQEVPEGTNANGQSYGSAEGVDSDTALPDLVAAYGSNGEFGYVKTTDLMAAEGSSAEVQTLPTTTNDRGEEIKAAPPRSISLFDTHGVTVLGQFVVG